WNDTGADQYWMWIGTSQGDYDVYSGNQGTNTSAVVTELPAGGETLHVRLMSKFYGEWLSNDYTYTACDLAAEISAPTPGSALSSTSVTFTWNDTGADQYWMWIGTSLGAYDVYSANQETNTSAVVAVLPAGGETLYVRLMSKFYGEWFSNDYTYTAYNP
ncbi:MAG: hypothetical protein GY710_14845, partial [Desulfobacteraceae bacterium]|nr:hypothetical protein [Desulfobacteraceae bacterium]